MKRILILLTFFFITPQVYAKSTATVKINNNVSSSSNTTSTVTNDITVETNGKVTHYSSDKSENIEINSNDDSSEIKVNGKNVLGDSMKDDNSKITATPSTSITPEEKDKSKNTLKIDTTNNKDIFTRFEEFIKKLFFFWK